MENIINIIKYSIKNYKLLYIVEAVIIGISFLTGIVNEGIVSNFISSATVIGISMTVITINTVAQVVLFTKQINKEQGYLFFAAPINGKQFIVAKIIEVIGVYLMIFIINILYLLIKFGLNNLFVQHGFTAIYGAFSYVTWIVVLLFFIAIVNSYIASTGLRVLAILALEVIGMPIYSTVISLIVYILPYINIVTEGGKRYNIIEIAINFVAIILLGVYCVKRIDNNLNIN